MSGFTYDSEEFRRELKNSPHHAGEVEFLRSICRPGMHVIEAGANRGVTAVALAKVIGKEGHLHAFEPVPEYCAVLKQNLSANGVVNTSVYQLALSDRQGRIRLHKHGAGSGITPSPNAEELWVQATTVTDFLRDEKIGRIDLLHLDCEGSEMLVLKGAKALLEEHAPEIFCEIHHPYLKELGQSAHDVITFLTGIGYDVQPLQVENLDAETSFENCSHICARKRVQEEDVQELKRKIADLKGRMPAHSVNPSMMQELEELEEQLKTAQENLER